MDRNSYRLTHIPPCCGICRHYKANNYAHQCWRDFGEKFRTYPVAVNGLCSRFEAIYNWGALGERRQA